MALGALVIVEEIAAQGPVKFSRCSLIGDGAYVDGGSDGFEAKFQASAGETRHVFDVKSCGNNGDLACEWVAPIAAFAVTVDATANTFTKTDGTAHQLSAGDAVEFTATALPGTVPLAATRYYVIASGLTTTVFKVSATLGGATIDPTTAGTAVKVARPGRLRFRVPSTGAENATADLSGIQHNLLVTSS